MGATEARSNGGWRWLSVHNVIEAYRGAERERAPMDTTWRQTTGGTGRQRGQDKRSETFTFTPTISTRTRETESDDQGKGGTGARDPRE